MPILKVETTDWSQSVTTTEQELWQARNTLFFTLGDNPGPNDGVRLGNGETVTVRGGETFKLRTSAAAQSMGGGAYLVREPAVFAAGSDGGGGGGSAGFWTFPTDAEAQAFSDANPGAVVFSTEAV